MSQARQPQRSFDPIPEEEPQELREGPFSADYVGCRPLTRSLLEALILDLPLTPAMRVDFGIETDEHRRALKNAIYEDLVSFTELDQAMGNGAKLTEIVRRDPDYPQRDVTFFTSWDAIAGRVPPPGHPLAGDAVEPGIDQSETVDVNDAEAMAKEMPAELVVDPVFPNDGEEPDPEMELDDVDNEMDDGFEDDDD